MKAAIVGCGGIAAVHAASISQLQGAVLTAFADIKKERAEDFASRYGGKAYGSLEEMLEQEKRMSCIFVRLIISMYLWRSMD